MMFSRSVFTLLGLCAFVGTIWATQQTSSQPQTSAAQRAKISGIVNSGAGQPVRKASVTLLPADSGNRGPQQGFAPPQPEPGQAPGARQNNPNGQNPGRGNGGARVVTTGEDGTFSFADVTAGSYRLRVDRDGFLSQEYGQRSWTGSGITLSVQGGQTLSGIAFQLVQGGTIIGRILDENLEPVAAIQVQSLSYVYQNGSRTLVTDRQVETNDLGEYRLYWLTPGDHYVSAVPNSRRGGLVQGNQGGPGPRGRGGPGGAADFPPFFAAENSSTETYAPTFFPGNIAPETATPVRVGAATEVRGIDFILRPTLTAKVSGRVIGMDIVPTAQQLQQQAQQQGQQFAPGRGNNAGPGGRGFPGGPGGRGMQVLLTRIGLNASGGRGTRGGPSFGGPGGPGGQGGRGGPGGFDTIASLAPVNPDGTFEVQGVIPGSYNLIAVQQTQDQIYSARMRLEVNSNVEGVSLAVRPGVEVPGQIRMEGTAPANFQINTLRVNLATLDALPIGNSTAEVDGSGKFTLTNVPAMSYRVSVQGLPSGSYLINGRFGSADALGDGIQVDQSEPLTLQIGFAPGQVAATISDSAGQPFSGAITVLIPATRNRIDLYKTATSDQSGQVTFNGVAPGDYKVIAWEDVPEGAYLNPDFLQTYEDRAQSVHLDRASSISVQLRVISRGQQ